MGFKFRFKFNIGSSGRTDPALKASGQEVSSDIFRPAVDRYRRRLGLFLSSMAAGVVLVFLSLFLPEPWLEWISIPGALLIFAALAALFSLPALTCPNCARSCDGFDRFCPVCGQQRLLISRFWGTRCDVCQKTWGSYKYRNYRIRYCTHCGVLLHQAGV